MKQTVLLLTLVSGLSLGACSSDSNLPNPTGKASITAINAIHGSPDMNFLIEERSIGTVAYQNTTATVSYDDLDYTFNFDVIFAGDSQFTRIGGQHIDFVADQHYTLVASGTLAAPTLTLWESAHRQFTDTDTVFQTRFSHTSDSLSAVSIDIYFALAGVAPVQGNAVATLAFGEISAPLDFEANDYVVTVTTTGNAADVLFTSRPTTILSRTDLVITPFDGDANNTSALVVQGLGVLGGAIPFHDSLASSTVQFLHAAMEMGNSDVFDDEALTSQILTNHTYRDLTADASVIEGSYQYFYTPTGDTSVVSLDTSFSAATGLHYRVTALGSGGDYSTTNSILDRRSVSTAVKLLYFPSSNNFEFTDLYVVDVGSTIEGQTPFRAGAVSRVTGPTLEMVPGSYDLYITEFLATEILAGPFRLDVEFGDVIDMVVFDTVDPAVLEIATYAVP